MKQNLDAFQISKKTIITRNLFDKNSYLMLMVSGGSDSVSLCYIINSLLGNEKFAIMHLNHNLRKEAKSDEKFVKDLSWYFNVPYFSFSENIEKIAKNNNENIEACAHKIRYKLANKACEQWIKQANIKRTNVLLCTAHSADDRIENFYMRSIVGTGPGGFSSLSYKNNNVIRPLLDIPKESLINYLKNLDEAFEDEDGNRWHEDKTNLDTDKFRAYVRHNIIPLAKHQNPNIINNLCNSMNLIADESEYIESQVSEITKKYIQFNNKSFFINPDFKNENIVLKRRAIYNALLEVFDENIRIETKSIISIMQASEQSNYTDNIQENYSVHSNKNGVLVQPMENYRKSRNRI